MTEESTNEGLLNLLESLWIVDIEKAGFPYKKDTPECVIYQSEHKSCKGCSSAMACGKLCLLLLVHMMPMQYKPNSFDDFQCMDRRIKELTSRIMDAKTEEELRSIPAV